MEVRALIFSQSLVGTPLHTVLMNECKDSGEIDVNMSTLKTNVKDLKSAAKGLQSEVKRQSASFGIPDAKFKLIVLPRSFFSEQKGGNLILRMIGQSDTPDAIDSNDTANDLKAQLKGKYIACASLNALSHYLEITFNLQLDSEFTLRYFFTKQHLHMDTQTCKSLSLFPETCVDRGTPLSSQFCLLNMFKLSTVIGKKTLRRRIFAPSADSNKIRQW